MDQCDSSEDEYEEMDEEILRIQCIFCSGHSFPSFEQIFAHISQEHNLDFVATCKSHNLGTFQFIQVVNYIRQNNVEPDQVDQIVASKVYDNEAYLKPVLEDDHLLMFDFEEDDVEINGTVSTESEKNHDLENHYKSLPKEDLIVDYILLKSKYDALLKNLSEMSEFIRGSIVDDGKCPEGNNVNNLDEKTDGGYISSYSHFGIHHEMLSDKPRTLAYKDAILENAAMFKGKKVLDIGCGTGILSLFAAKAGAELVVAVDQSDIIYSAIDIVRKNGFENIIKPVKGKLESIQFASLNLPTKYDFIVSEWMGYFLLFEGMLDTVIYARDHLMEEGGKLLPNRSKIFLAAFSDSNFYERNVDFWNDVYGFSMSSMISDVTSEATVDNIKGENICSSTEAICQFDINQCSLDDATKVTSSVKLKFEQNATIHGLVGWFDCYFDSLARCVVLSTSPFADPTHWKQTIFLFREPISIEAKGTLTIDVEITRSSSNARGVLVKMLLKDYNMPLEYSINC